MGIVAIIGIIEAINKLALTARTIREQWKRDNPGQPLPPEMEDATLIAAFQSTLEGATATWDALIARLQERADGELG